jgi:hypothetical protein
MIQPEHARLIPVAGDADTPDMASAIEVQFNPATLKVSLSNTLKESETSGSSRAAQFVDKSSSTLSVELVFDTTWIDEATAGVYRERASAEGLSLEPVEAGSDVRKLTGRIAEMFIKPVGEGEQMQAPRRCLFQWGAFEFLGMVQSFDETLDFFSPEGQPLRATVGLKLAESRYQFRSRELARAQRDTPSFATSGSADPAAPAATLAGPGKGGAAQRDWRSTALFNGLESPRLAGGVALAVPGVSASAAATPAGFRFGASGGLGTGIQGAFGDPGKPARLSRGATASVRVGPGDGVGFD